MISCINRTACSLGKTLKEVSKDQNKEFDLGVAIGITLLVLSVLFIPCPGSILGVNIHTIIGFTGVTFVCLLGFMKTIILIEHIARRTIRHYRGEVEPPKPRSPSAPSGDESSPEGLPS